MKWFFNLNITTKFILFFAVGMAFFLGLAGWSQYGFSKMEKIDHSVEEIATLRKYSMSSALVAFRYAAAVENGIKDTSTANYNILNQLLSSIEKNVNLLSADDVAIKEASEEVISQVKNILDIPSNPDEGLVEESELLGDISLEYNEKLLIIGMDLGLLKKAFQEKYDLWTNIVLVLSMVMAGVMVIVLRMTVILPLERLREFSNDIASGNLVDELDISSNDEIGQLASALIDMKNNLKNIVGEVHVSSDNIKDTSSAIYSDNNDLSELTESQAVMLGQTVTNINSISAAIKQNAESAQKADELACNSNEVASDGAMAITMILGSMDDVEASNKEIADITAVIDGIAFQTNLLALNAAVEAARAGEEGRGFAVVASEVRNLAKRSSESAKNIRHLIDESVRKTEKFSEQVEKSGFALSEIIGAVRDVAKVVTEIAEASHGTAINIDHINSAVEKMNDLTQENKNIVQNAAKYSVRLKDQADHLNELVGFFQVDGTARLTEEAVTLDRDDSND